MESLRLRVVFDDRHLLTETQKSEGLKRSWILLKPEIETVSDLAFHLTHSFGLHQTCPNDIRISMDGFVLPPFESIHVFKDKDIIRVKKNKGAASDNIRVGDEANTIEFVEKRPVLTGVNLLALEEFEKEAGGYQSEPEENEYESPENTLHLETPPSGKISKKRKSSNKLHSSKRKRIKSACSEDSSKVPIEGVENVVSIKAQFIRQKEILSKKSLRKDKSSKTTKLKKTTKAKLGNRHEDNAEHKRTTERCDSVGENLEKPNNVPEGTKKGPSRSARRKKAKRKWLRELMNSKKEELIQSIHDKVACDKSEEYQESKERTDPDPEIVPIVVKPGHIRFEPLDEDHSMQQNHSSVEVLKWNGITSKRKGQKWGMEKASVSWSNNYDNFGEDSLQTEKFQWNDIACKNRKSFHTENTSRSKNNGNANSRDDLTKKLNLEDSGLVHDPVDFEKLNPLACSPKEGDVVAYRVVELSSTWCPELSTFRVGKVSWFNSASNIVMLVPVPGYPVVSDEKRDEEEATLESDTSLYYEDGSLEINFASLVDVRIFSHGHSNPESVSTASTKEAPPINKEVPLGTNEAVDKSAETQVRTTRRSKEVPTNSTEAPLSSIDAVDKNEGVRSTENGGSVDVWEELSHILSDKKTQLAKEREDWSVQKEHPGKSQRSHRSLRSGALGPTIARLRAANDL